MRSLKSVKQTRISEEITAQLKNAIFRGHYLVGEKLPSEKELCNQFQASRVVVREAVRALELTGFIELKQGAAGGAFVKDLSFHNVSTAVLDLFIAKKISAQELLYVRSYIEPEIIRLVVDNITEEAIFSLKKAYLAELEPSIPYAERVHRQLEVHYILAQACGNRLYEVIMTILLDLTKEMFLVVKSEHNKIHDAEEHNEIIQAVSSGDAEAASEAMIRHLDHLYTGMVQLEKLYRESRDVPLKMENDDPRELSTKGQRRGDKNPAQ